MTTTTKKKKSPAKATAKRSTRESKQTLIPPSAGVTVVDGRKFVIMPLEDFEEWQDEQLFAALMRERLATDEELIPMEEVERRLDAKKKKRS